MKPTDLMCAFCGKLLYSAGHKVTTSGSRTAHPREAIITISYICSEDGDAQKSDQRIEQEG